MENDEIVCIADDDRFFTCAARLRDFHFQSVQGYIGKQRRDDPTLGCPLFGGCEYLPIHDARLEPPPDKVGELGVGVQLLEESFMVNVVEAALNIGIEDKFGLVSDAVEDRSDGIMS